MKLGELLEALGANGANPDVNVTIIDNNDVKLITYNAAGYGSIESDLSAKKVKKIQINTMTSVTVYIDNDDVPDSEPTPDPEPTPEPDPDNP
jgi:Flp pilus assembly CpaF family ATPase